MCTAEDPLNRIAPRFGVERTNFSNADDLLNEASNKYPFIKNNNVKAFIRNKSNDELLAETWRPGDEGSMTNPRPNSFPIDATAIEIYNNKFTPDDIAGEVMHTDKYAQLKSSELLKALSGKQLDSIIADSPDYEYSKKIGMPNDKAVSNAVDSMVRGYVVGQWPKESIDAIGLDSNQQSILSDLKNYITSGKENGRR